MTTFDHATRSMPAAAQPAFAVRVVNTVVSVARALKNRRAFYRLADMTDAELADIGLTRADLSVAIALPLGSDPTAHLGSVADARTRRIDEMARRVG